MLKDCLHFYMSKLPGAYCIKLLLEKNSGYLNRSFFLHGKMNGKIMFTRVFRFYQSFFSGKSFLQQGPGVQSFI